MIIGSEISSNIGSLESSDPPESPDTSSENSNKCPSMSPSERIDLQKRIRTNIVSEEYEHEIQPIEKVEPKSTKGTFWRKMFETKSVTVNGKVVPTQKLREDPDYEPEDEHYGVSLPRSAKDMLRHCDDAWKNHLREAHACLQNLVDDDYCRRVLRPCHVITKDFERIRNRLWHIKNTVKRNHEAFVRMRCRSPSPTSSSLDYLDNDK